MEQSHKEKRSSFNPENTFIELISYECLTDKVAFSFLTESNEKEQMQRILHFINMIRAELIDTIKNYIGFVAVYIDHKHNDVSYMNCNIDLNIIEDCDQFFSVLKALAETGLLDKNFKFIPRSTFKCRKIVIGAIYFLIQNKFFTPTYLDKRFTRQKLNDADILRIISKQLNLKRYDQVHDPVEKLVDLALNRIPKLKEFKRNHHCFY